MGRLQIFGILSTVEEAEFSMVRDATGMSDSVLSKHVRALEDAGYVRVRKATTGGRQRTWLAVTGPGRAAFRSHVAELTRLAGLAGAAT